MKSAPNIAFHKASGRLTAYVNLSGRRHYLGLFDSESEAASAATEFKIANDIEIDDKAPLIERVRYDDGALFWRQHGRGHAKGDRVGSVDAKSGYRCLRTQSGKVYLHRLTWELHYGPIPAGLEIDHINGQRDDNHIENLRLVDRAQNLKNKRIWSRNKSGKFGISINPQGRFCARIGNAGKTIKLGTFSTVEEAVQARTLAEQKMGFHKNHGRK